MKTRTVIAILASLSLCACALSPGAYLDDARLDNSIPADPPEDKFPVHPIDYAYFHNQPSTDAAPTVCPLECLTPAVRRNYKYHIGIGDQLTVIVWDHPELGGGAMIGGGGAVPPLPQGAAGMGAGGGAAGGAGAAALGAGAGTGAGAGAGTSGGGSDGGLATRVASDGMFFFPRVGRVKALGRTTEEIQVELTARLAKTIRNPQIDVRVSGFNSQSIQATGDLRAPNAQPITDVPLTVLDAINRAGGAPADADLQNVGVTRDGTRHVVNVAAQLETGDEHQNVLLQDGDILDVPDRTNSRVFVLGEVGKPASLPMNRGKLTLADALAGAGSIDPKSSDPRFIYVIRGAEREAIPTVYRLDMTQVDAMLMMTRFDLQPKDVVYVQIKKEALFNRALEQITETLQTLFFTRQLAP